MGNMKSTPGTQREGEATYWNTGSDRDGFDETNNDEINESAAMAICQRISCLENLHTDKPNRIYTTSGKL